MKPRRERAVAAKGGQATPCPYEDILHELCRFLSRSSGKPEAKGKNPWGMSAIENLERARVPGLRATYYVVRFHGYRRCTRRVRWQWSCHSPEDRMPVASSGFKQRQ